MKAIQKRQLANLRSLGLTGRFVGYATLSLSIILVISKHLFGSSIGFSYSGATMLTGFSILISSAVIRFLYEDATPTEDEILNKTLTDIMNNRDYSARWAEAYAYLTSIQEQGRPITVLEAIQLIKARRIALEESKG